MTQNTYTMKKIATGERAEIRRLARDCGLEVYRLAGDILHLKDAYGRTAQINKNGNEYTLYFYIQND